MKTKFHRDGQVVEELYLGGIRLKLTLFFAKCIFYICDEANFINVVWRGFIPQKLPEKLTEGVLQILLSNSVNFVSLFHC